jgi:hypothetical protein
MKIDLSNSKNISESFLSYFLEFSEDINVKVYLKSSFSIVFNSLVNTYNNLLLSADNDFDLKYQYSLINDVKSKYSKYFMIIRYKFFELLMSINKDVENFRKFNLEYSSYVSKNALELVKYYDDYKTKLIQSRKTALDDDFLDKLDIWCRKSQEFTEERYKKEFVVNSLMQEILEINKIIVDNMETL